MINLLWIQNRWWNSGFPFHLQIHIQNLHYKCIGNIFEKLKNKTHHSMKYMNWKEQVITNWQISIVGLSITDLWLMMDQELITLHNVIFSMDYLHFRFIFIMRNPWKIKVVLENGWSLLKRTWPINCNHDV